MFEKLIGNLRACSSCDFGQDCGRCTLKSSETTFCCDILLHEAADVIEALSTSQDTDMAFVEEDGRMVIKFLPRWIPVTERLPKERGDYLVYTVGGSFNQLSATEMAFWDNDKFIVKSFLDVTHWIPLPDPPIAEDGE